MYIYVDRSRYNQSLCGLCGYMDGDNGDNDFRLRNGKQGNISNINEFGDDWEESNIFVSPRNILYITYNRWLNNADV